nr:adenylate isopentenyltransferase 3, chloroplastic-like [Ipomoea trifida]
MSESGKILRRLGQGIERVSYIERMELVTNKITEEERRDVPHRHLGVIELTKNFTATNFYSMASRTISR